MPRRPAALLLTAPALAAALLAPLAARADVPQVNAALLFLQASCGLKDAKLEARRSEGRLLLTLRTPQVTRQTNLVHNDLRMFTEESMKKNSEMPPELGACFDPASNQIIDVLMGLPANVASLPLAPTPAAPTAQQGGGYVPPMVGTPAPAPTVVQATPAPPVPAPMQAPAPTQGVLLADGGPVRVAALRLDVQPKSPGNWSGDVMGRVGIDITNLGPNAIRVALVREYPKILDNGGLEFHFRGASGLHEDYYGNEGNCGGRRSDYTPLRPGQTAVADMTLQYIHGGRDNTSPTSGRVSGKLMVWDEVKQTCRVEPLAASALPIRMVR